MKNENTYEAARGDKTIKLYTDLLLSKQW